MRATLTSSAFRVLREHCTHRTILQIRPLIWTPLYRFCLLVNNITGPAMVQVPSLFASSGTAITTFLFLVIALWSFVAALFMAQAVGHMPGNARHTQRYEIAKMTATLLPRWASNAFIAMLCFSLTALNISQVRPSLCDALPSRPPHSHRAATSTPPRLGILADHRHQPDDGQRDAARVPQDVRNHPPAGHRGLRRRALRVPVCGQ